MIINSRDINLLHPILKAKCQELVNKCAEHGFLIKVISTYRNAEYQNSLKKGTTKATAYNSYHQWGLAFDIAVFNPDGKTILNNWNPKKGDNWFKAGEIGKELGIEWGGDWTSIKDYGHFQIKVFNLIGLKDGTAVSKDKFFTTVYDYYKKGI